MSQAETARSVQKVQDCAVEHRVLVQAENRHRGGAVDALRDHRAQLPQVGLAEVVG
ncbi:hypothetical protein [Streptomyces sp. NPDC046161]|uniref:hypothetical protein n=1 Tax=Streptomyces sp. NPDC046161 TaxID=3155132 RepID=UPI0033D14B98